MTMKTMETDVLPPEFEKAINAAVSSAVDKLDITQMVKDALRKLDIDRIVDEAFAEAQAG